MQETLQCCIGCNVQDNSTPQTLVIVFVEDNNRQITIFLWEDFAYSIGIMHGLRVPVGQISLDLIRTTFPKIGRAAVVHAECSNTSSATIPGSSTSTPPRVLELRSPPEQAVSMTNTTAETCDP
jgi:hypothetical protein